ncbi:MAG: 3-phosphoshikimate 1-carboxyvinyltransferase [Bdellovibrionales bacterium]
MSAIMVKAISKQSSSINGITKVPGDKSISHRSLMFGAMTEGETMISGLLEGEDVLHTADAMRAMGAKIERGDDGLWRTFGVGLGNLKQPQHHLEMGNSGTSTRLLMGIVAGHDITATFTGDDSLIKRPMKRIMTPLSEMGAEFMGRDGDKLPMTVTGAKECKSIEYKLPVASAQVKSAIMLAGLNANGTTTIIEEQPTRDHSENMLRHFGIDVDIEDLGNKAKAIHVKGGQTMQACAVDVPGDPSSAAFPVAAAIMNEGSDLTINHICINPTRIGFYTALQSMGADIEFINQSIEGGEPVADIRVRGIGPLKGVDLDPTLVPAMIDEFPIFSMIASCASGTTKMTDLAELRVKESDRLLMVAQGLQACGISLDMGEDSLTINSNGQAPIGGGHIKTALDHRIAMAFLTFGSVTNEPITIDDATPIATSFPNFMTLMNEIGCDIDEYAE